MGAIYQYGNSCLGLGSNGYEINLEDGYLAI